jgi:Helix-turn-helix domain
MEHITGRLSEIARNIEIVGADVVTLHGFTQVPNFILTNQSLSVGAKLTYAMLLKYHWTNNAVFPGQKKLAEEMGSGERSVRTYLKELEDAKPKLLEVTQRGLGKTNLYRLYVTVQKGGQLARRLS